MKEGWQRLKLNDVCIKTSNIKWSEIKESKTYIDLSSVDRDSLSIKETQVVNSSNAPSRAKKIVREQDVIFATTRPTLKRVTIIPSLYHNQICSTGYSVIRPNYSLIESKYIFYFLQSDEFMDRMDSLQRGASYPAVTDSDVKNTLINVPPLPEQKRIVAILDEAFTAIDQIQANIQRNIHNAEELFQSKLNQIFSQKGDGWEEKKLSEIANIKNGYSFKSGDFSEENEIPAIKITNVGIKKFVPDEKNNLPIQYLEDYSRVIVKSGDIVIALTRTIISSGLKVAIVPLAYNNSLLNQRVACISAINQYVSNSYLFNYFSSHLFSIYVLSNVNELMQPNLSIKDLKATLIPFPAKDQQELTVMRLNNLYTDSTKMSDNYKTQLLNLSDLKKSILQKAFKGELTEKDILV